MDRKLFLNNRVLFVRSNCPHCKIWLTFIERINMNLPIEKRIRVIDCKKLEDFGIIEHPLIRAYKKYIEGYPTMFIDGQKIDGANTREEMEAYLKGRLFNEFIVTPNMTVIADGKEFDLLFRKQCQFKNTLFGRKIICKE